MLRAVVTAGLVLCAAPSASAAPAAPPETAAPPAGPPPATSPVTVGAEAAPPAAAPPPGTAPPAAAPPAAAPPAAAPPAAAPAETPTADPTGAELAPTTAGPPVPAAPAPAAETPPDEEVADPSPDPFEDEPDEEEEAIATPPPPPALPPEIPAPLYRGRGMLISGSVVGIVGLIVKIVGSAQAVRAVRLRDPEITGVNVLVAAGLVYNPILGTGLGLVGGGLAQRGEWDAHHELFDSAAHKPRMKKSRRKLGWGLFGGGVGLWGITRLLSLACPSDGCAVATLEVGYYTSLAMTVPGVAMASWGTGHDNYKKRFGALKKSKIQLSPTAGNTWGLAASGRF